MSGLATVSDGPAKAGRHTKPTTSMPDVLRKSRRPVVLAVVMALPVDRARGALDGGLHTVIRHAAAQDPGHAVADLRVGRPRIAIEQRLGCEHLAVLAETARGDLLGDPG